MSRRVRERSLRDLWLDPEYVAYRRRMPSCAFPSCTFGGERDGSVTNEENSFNNPFPTCGGCLWAQGIIAISRTYERTTPDDAKETTTPFLALPLTRRPMPSSAGTQSRCAHSMR